MGPYFQLNAIQKNDTVLICELQCNKLLHICLGIVYRLKITNSKRRGSKLECSLSLESWISKAEDRFVKLTGIGSSAHECVNKKVGRGHHKQGTSIPVHFPMPGIITLTVFHHLPSVSNNGGCYRLQRADDCVYM